MTSKLPPNILVRILAVIAVGSSLLSCVGTAVDHERVTSYRDALEASYPFKMQRKDGEGVAVYCTALPGRNYISVYGDYNEEETAAINEVAQRLQRSRNETVKTEIKFYKEELREETHYKTIVVE